MGGFITGVGGGEGGQGPWVQEYGPGVSVCSVCVCVGGVSPC